MATQPVTAQAARSESATAVAETLAIRAMRFTQGDTNSLTAHQSDFTNSAWTAFLKQFSHLVDAEGAPRFSQWFRPYGPATLISQLGTVTRLRIPGMLTQSTQTGRNTHYESNRGVVEIEVQTPAKIRSLTWTACTPEAARSACM